MSNKLFIDHSELMKLLELLGIEENAKDAFFGSLDNAKILGIYGKLKSKVKINQAIKYMNLVLELSNYKIDKELAEEFLLDESLQELIISDSKKSKNLFLQVLSNNVKNEMSEGDLEIEYSDDEIIYPLYDIDEEIVAFEKYDAWRRILKRYIYEHNYVDFINYITSLDTSPEHETKEFLLLHATEKLYSDNCNEECVVNIKKDKELMKIVDECKETRDDISIHNYRLTVACAKRYESFGLPIADLIQEGNIGLMKAIEKFDVDRGYKFSTYATWWINQAIKRALANDGNIIRVPVYLHEMRNKVNKAIKILREQDGLENPSTHEIYEKCQELGFDFTLVQVEEIKKLKIKSEPISTDKAIGEDEDSVLIDFIADDNYATEDYAEFIDMKNNVEKMLALVEKGMTASGKQLKVSTAKTVFKQVEFMTTEGKKIKILLTLAEYDYYIKYIKEENGRERFIEFLDKYKINKDKLTSYHKISDYILTNQKREVLVFRLRTGIWDDFTTDFVEQRNYNNALFVEETDNNILTLEKSGKLLNITRERVRQIENKVGKKVNPEKVNRISKARTTQYVLMDEPDENLFNLFNVVNQIDYVVIIPQNDIIKVDSCYNIHPLKPGNVTVILKNVRRGGERELTISVRKPFREMIKESKDIQTKNYSLTLNGYKKDSQ